MVRRAGGVAQRLGVVERGEEGRFERCIRQVIVQPRIIAMVRICINGSGGRLVRRRHNLGKAMRLCSLKGAFWKKVGLGSTRSSPLLEG